MRQVSGTITKEKRGSGVRVAIQIWRKKIKLTEVPMWLSGL